MLVLFRIFLFVVSITGRINFFEYIFVALEEIVKAEGLEVESINPIFSKKYDLRMSMSQS